VTIDPLNMFCETLYNFISLLTTDCHFLCHSTMLYIRKPGMYWPNWTIFFSPLKFKLWLCVATAVLFLSAGLSATSLLGHRYGREGPHLNTFSDSILCVFGSLCSQGKSTWSCDISSGSFPVLEEGILLCFGTYVREKILSPLPGIEIRSPGRPARSQTLY
jgi:hypothetical protein